MVLRETQFFVGGLLTIGLGVSLGYGLYWSGAGAEYFGGWLAAGISVGLGAFFLYVARDEHRTRLAFLEAEERGDLRVGPGRPPTP
jgi:hypothetical protein